MAYTIYLVDNTNSIKLDCDNIDMTTTFAVADITDLSARKDSITKTVVFKGTKRNNSAFGSMFHFNRVSSTGISNKLGFNYNSLVPVDCLVYEDGNLLLYGSLRVLDVDVNKGIISYQTVITGKFIELKTALQDKLLTDINFTDLKHRYSKENIKAAWGYTNEIYNPTTHTFSNVVFQNGSNYVYPFIDYAQKFLIEDSNATNSDHAIFHALNFRPAVWVKEYFKRIFAAAGWTFEVKGSTDFLLRFNAAFVPHSAEKLKYDFSGFNLHFQKPSPVVETESGSQYLPSTSITLLSAELLTINGFTPPTGIPITPPVTVQSTRLLNVNRNFTADAQVNIDLSSIHNPWGVPVQFKCELVQRPASTSTEQINTWGPIASNEFTLNPHETISSKHITLNVGEYNYVSNTNLAIRIFLTHPNIVFPSAQLSYTVNATSLDIPKNGSTPFGAEIELKDSDYDVIAPKAPENIKQMDFLTSVMRLFNLYAYTHKNNPKHLIFETYDDFYALGNREYVVSNSLDWSHKINHDTIKRIPMLTIPKNYTFTYKDDGDWINTEYKKNFGLTFGTFQFKDALGVTDSKKIELIFSPTPVIEPVGTLRKHAALYTLDGANTKPSKTNIRILYYNGIKSCSTYYVWKDKYTTAWTTQEVYPPATLYPQATTYYYDYTGKPIEDLNFGRPNEYFFPANADYINASTAYSKYYSNQTTELTNVNVYTVQVDALLNEVDINNLDLRVPVFIDFGEYGHSYFKVLSIEYQNNKLLSKVVLQQIYLGTNS